MFRNRQPPLIHFTFNPQPLDQRLPTHSAGRFGFICRADFGSGINPDHGCDLTLPLHRWIEYYVLDSAGLYLFNQHAIS